MPVQTRGTPYYMAPEMWEVHFAGLKEQREAEFLIKEQREAELKEGEHRVDIGEELSRIIRAELSREDRVLVRRGKSSPSGDFFFHALPRRGIIVCLLVLWKSWSSEQTWAEDSD